MSLLIKDLFQKDINRNIETVIKADDRDHISDEVVEYVITAEITKKITTLFREYNDYAGANGVWISGFFGSGKSHLLKILSYVFENKEVGGYQCGELFAEKIENDELLKADIYNSTRIPSESILFNIDQQAQNTNNTEDNAILAVFYKVFYDHMGFYGAQSHVAEFEMWLYGKKQFDSFKQSFIELHGKSWLEARRDYFDPLVTDDVAVVLGKLNNAQPSKYENIIDNIEDKQIQSIDDFCSRVHDYIMTKPKGFRLNFFVDEVGQYISDNTRLMLNLQTIAETLATRTRGHSWVFVTSQEDMDKVVGDMNRAQQNDFSRIQARFRIKIPLTSANVDEVIEKRLLKKHDNCIADLGNTFQSEQSHLESLLSFSEAGVQFRNYLNEIDFINKYPFIPYQFDLFQQCRRALSTHNAFQGRHASVGERSMLGVFQQVVQSILAKDTTALVSFDMMFEGIRNELKGQIQNSIILAERNVSDPFTVRVLKALFLVKYFSNFKSTKRNVAVLMIDNMHLDLKQHEQKITEALTLLENQSYIQRNGDLYEYLTDEEKDVEEEIKNTDIDESAVTSLIKELLFDEIIKDTRIKYQENKIDYDFSPRIDGILLGRQKELDIEIVTENHPNYLNENILAAQTMGTTTLRVVLSSNAIFMKDLKMYLKVNKYVKQSQNTSNKPELKRIIQDKGMQNAERRRNLILMANQSLASASFFINGAKKDISFSNDGKQRIINAFQILIQSVYPNLRMLRNISFTEDSIKNIFSKHQDDLFAADDTTISEAEMEVLNFISRRKNNSDATVLTQLKEAFTKKPYGWYPNAIWTIVARLYKRAKIELKQGANVLENGAVLSALMNTHLHNQTRVEPQATFDTKAVNALKQLFRDVFDTSSAYRDAKDIAHDFKSNLELLLEEVNHLLDRKREYHFISELDDLAELLTKLTKKDYAYFLTNIKDFEDDLLDAKEDFLDPIRRFVNSDQIKIYDSIKSIVLSDTENIRYVEGSEFKQISEFIQDKKPYSSNKLQLAKEAKDILTAKLDETIRKERENAKNTMLQLQKSLSDRADFLDLSPEQQAELMQAFNKQIMLLDNTRLIPSIREAYYTLKDKIYPAQLSKLANWSIEVSNATTKSNEPKVQYLKRGDIKPKFHKPELRTEQDVEQYIELMKMAMLRAIKENKRIYL